MFILCSSFKLLVIKTKQNKQKKHNSKNFILYIILPSNNVLLSDDGKDHLNASVHAGNTTAVYTAGLKLLQKTEEDEVHCKLCQVRLPYHISTTIMQSFESKATSRRRQSFYRSIQDEVR